MSSLEYPPRMSNTIAKAFAYHCLTPYVGLGLSDWRTALKLFAKGATEEQVRMALIYAGIKDERVSELLSWFSMFVRTFSRN